LSQPSLPPVSVPTLTEVVEWAPAVPPPPLDAVPTLHDEMPVLCDAAWPVELTTPTPTPTQPQAFTPVDEAQLTQRILEQIEQQLDTLFSERLSPLMLAVLDRAVEELAAHARNELASALPGIVSQAVSQELSQRQDRGAAMSSD
jgi:hypothetical protein